MKVDNDIAFLDDLLYTKTGKRLNTLQKSILRGTWHNLKYPDIAKTEHRSPKYVKSVGFKLWKLLSDMLEENTNQSNFRAVMEKTKLAIDLSSATDFSQINSFNFCSTIVHFPNISQTETQDKSKQDISATNKKDLSEMPNISTFYGRTQELTTLQKWIVQEKSRLVTILGISGIGKTAIAVKLINQITDNFNYTFWCSLRNKPSLDIIKTNLLKLLSENPHTDNKPNFPQTSQTHLINSLKKHRCLIILDDVQMLFQSGELAGKYENEYEDYASFFKEIGETNHNSCLVLLSGEKPLEIAYLEAENQQCKSLQLAGLDVDAAYEILKQQGLDTSEKWQDIINQYSGNPSWLKMLARIIQDLGFTDLCKQESTFLFTELEYKLNQQFKRLSIIEKKVISTMANIGDRMTITQISDHIPQSELLNTLPSLLRRSFIDKNVNNGDTNFTIQPVIREYLKQGIN